MNKRHHLVLALLGQRVSRKIWTALTVIMIGAVLPGIGCCMANSGTQQESMVGGSCEYRPYPGQAEILSVAPIEAAGERFDVQFRFVPDQPVEEPLGRTALQRTFTLLPEREMPPDRAYIEEFDIRPGTRIGCTLKVITRGTCTPILFDFPSLTPGDVGPR
jgi:hypothetical protein